VKKIKIKMIEHSKGSDRKPVTEVVKGEVVVSDIAMPCIAYVKGKTYTVGQELANCFFDMEVAEKA